MAEKKEKIKKIEEIAKDMNLSLAVLEGVKALKNFATGKEVTEEEFKQAVDEFLNSSIDGAKEE